MDCQKILVYGLIILVSIYLLKDVCGVKLPFIEGFDNVIGEDTAVSGNSANSRRMNSNMNSNGTEPFGNSNMNSNGNGPVASNSVDSNANVNESTMMDVNSNNGVVVGQRANRNVPSELTAPTQVLASEPMGNEVNMPVQGLESVDAPCYPQNTLSPADLLPSGESGEIEQLNQQMNQSGDGCLANINFLESGHNIGVNTVGQSLRNANLNLRAEPPNPRTMVSPWMNSTIDVDLQRRPLGDTYCGPQGADSLSP